MIEIGSNVPLHLQAYDGRDDLEVDVVVLNPAQEVIFEGTLIHVLNGFYQSRQLLMPDVEYVIALYSVSNSKDYEQVSDIFYSESPEVDVTSPVKALLDEHVPLLNEYFTGKVEHEWQSDDFLEGKLIGESET